MNHLNCEKTGGFAYMQDYGVYVYGDIFSSPNGTIVVNSLNFGDNEIPVGHELMPKQSEVWAVLPLVHKFEAKDKTIWVSVGSGRLLRQFRWDDEKQEMVEAVL